MKYIAQTLSMLTLLLSCIIPAEVEATFSINPWIMQIDPTSENPTQWLTLDCPKNEQGPIAIEVLVLKRSQRPDGHIFYESADSDPNFLVYRRQQVLYPGESQMVYVQWIGEVIPNQEQVYSVITRQMPIDLGEDVNEGQTAAKLYTLVEYEPVLFLRPPNTMAKVDVVASEMIDIEGTPHLKLTLANNGTASAKIQNLSFNLSPTDESGQTTSSQAILYQPEYDRQMTKYHLYPGFERELVLPWPSTIPQGPVKASAMLK